MIHPSRMRLSKRAGVATRTSARLNSGMASMSPLIFDPFVPAFTENPLVAPTRASLDARLPASSAARLPASSTSSRDWPSPRAISSAARRAATRACLTMAFSFTLRRIAAVFAAPRALGAVGLSSFLSFPRSEKTPGFGNSLVCVHSAASSAMYATCLPSSTFGTSTIMEGQHRPCTFVPPRPGAPTDATIGSTYANVLPLPVSARMTTSSPLTSSGIASRWISVVRRMPAFCIAAAMCSGMPARANGLDATASVGETAPAATASARFASRAARAVSHGRGPPRLYAVFTPFSVVATSGRAIGPASSDFSAACAASRRAVFSASRRALPFLSAALLPLSPSPMKRDQPPSSSSSPQ